MSTEWLDVTSTVGIDLGSSNIKVCTFEFSENDPPALQTSQSVECPLIRPQSGWVEHDIQSMSKVLNELIDELSVGKTLSFASAMHGLVLLDPSGRPLTNAISWADTRSSEQARLLKEKFPEHQQRTGTPMHAMAWPAKLNWLASKRPVWWNQTARVTDLKGYLLENLLGFPVPMDISNASATGLWDQEDDCWDEELLSFLELPTEYLPEVQTGTAPLLWKGREVYFGGGDGPLGNLGVGATTGDRIAISLGTSGAVRQPDRSAEPLPPALFRYAIDSQLSVRGGAISNGTSVLDWLQNHYGVSLNDVLEWFDESPVGANGLLIYPYFSGERAPFWAPNRKAGILGMSFDHTAAHITRAALEGVAFCLRRLVEELRPSKEPIRCTGGMFSSESWQQLLADVTGQPIAVSPIQEATALGAALMATDDYLNRSAALPMGNIVEPDSERAQEYDEIYRRWLESEPDLSNS